VTRVCSHTSTPSRSRSCRARRWSGSGNSRARCLGCLDQDDAGGTGIEAPVVALQRPPRELGDLPGELDTGRPRAHHDERQPGSALLDLGFELGHLERPEDPSAQLQRVIDRLHARFVHRELGVTEIRLSRPGSHDQTVIRNTHAFLDRLEHHLTGPDIDVHDFAQQRPRIALVTQHFPERRRDVSLRQDARRHLVEQRLEQVVVRAVNDRDVHRSRPQCAGGEQPTEPGPDDHDTVSRWPRAVRGSGRACGPRRSSSA
jgi:hypothetical protein